MGLCGGAIKNGLACDDSQGGSGAGVENVKWRADSVTALKLLGTSDGLAVGELGMINGTGNIYEAQTALAGSSTWHPATNRWFCRDFGADGTAADSSTEVQATIDECAAEGVGDVGLDDIYTVTSAIVMKNGVSIVGRGEQHSGIVGALLGPLLTDNATPVRNCRFAFFQLDNSDRENAGGKGFEFTGGGSRVVFEQVRVYNARTAYDLSGQTLTTFEECYATTVKTGVRCVAGSNETNAYACVVNDVDTIGYELDAVSNCTFHKCSVQGLSTGDGYHVDNAANSNVITQPRIENATATGQTGIRIDDSTCTSNKIDRPFVSNITTTVVDNGTNTTHYESARMGIGVDPASANASRDNGNFGTLSGSVGGITVWGSSTAGIAAGENDGSGGVTTAKAGDFYYNFASQSWRMDIEGTFEFIWRNNGSNKWYAPIDTTTQLGIQSGRWGKSWVGAIAFRVAVDAATINLDAETGVEVDSSGGARTINLPTLTSVNDEGRLYLINLIAGGSAATLTAQSGDNINGSGTTRDLNASGTGLYIAWSSGDGARWHVFGPVAAT